MRKGVNKVALRLFEHNEKAYHAAVRMMEQYGKAAIVHPTGTGKSYIAFKLIEDNPEKVVIWLSPSEYIFKTQLESLKRNDPDFPLANVHFYTYAKLMCCTEGQLAEIAGLQPSYIILDEFHRAGAECWGESTVALLKLCPEAKLLGLTATNVRYLDNNRDMAEELFDGCVASDMTLGEAIVRGILPTPNYVTTVYQYQKDLARYQTRVDNLRSAGIQDVNQKYLDALRRALEQADGLDKVFEHHITNKSGKYIVFCANKEHMDEMISHVPEWFAKVNAEVGFDCERNLAIHDLEHRLRQGKLSFASEQRMERWLGLRPGSVSPFGLINDPARHVHLFLDASLQRLPAYSFHPNDNRATVVISREEFLRYLAAVGNTYEFIELY